jgi:hypothetical protein
LLRFLVSLGVLQMPSPGSFSLTPTGATLRSGVPGSVRPLVDMLLDQRQYEPWDHLIDSVNTGRSAFEILHGEDIWSYRARNLEQSRLFDAAMASSVPLINRSLVNSYDFSATPHVIDVGGGNGALLIAVLEAYPDNRGTLFDQPHVISGASERVAAAGLAARVQLAAGNFFERVPPGGDAYLLSRILHDWDDERSIAILQQIRRATPAHGKLLVMERIIPDVLQASPFDQDIMCTDLHMLVVTGGRERTAAELDALFEAAGLKLSRIITTDTTTSIIEAVPA